MRPVDPEFQKYIEPRLREHLQMLPPHMHDSIMNYVLHRLEPGDFMYAVLTNNLKEAVVHADHINKDSLVGWVEFCMWYLPSICWGSPQRVNAWLNPAPQVQDDSPDSDSGAV
jgi:hypothetical protein